MADRAERTEGDFKTSAAAGDCGAIQADSEVVYGRVTSTAVVGVAFGVAAREAVAAFGVLIREADLTLAAAGEVTGGRSTSVTAAAGEATIRGE